MVNISLSDFLNGIRQRKGELRIVDTEEFANAMRNNGSRRTVRKRAMLARLEARARANGIPSPKAKF